MLMQELNTKQGHPTKYKAIEPTLVRSRARYGL